MRGALHRLTPQPLVGLLTAMAACFAMGAVYTQDGLPTAMSTLRGESVLSVALALVVVGCHRFTIHLPGKTRVYLGTAPLYLMTVLLSPSLAVTAAGASKLCGELWVRRQSGLHRSDVAAQVGRWVVLSAVGASIVHAGVGASLFGSAPILFDALALWAGDILTSPLILSPITGERPSAVIVGVVREAAPAEASHYLVAMLGALAARQAAWSLVLLALPTALVYLAFKSAKDMHESARQLLSSVVESALDAMLVIDLAGTAIVCNGQAVSLFGLPGTGAIPGWDVLSSLSGDDRARAGEDMRVTVETGRPRTATYSVTRADSSKFDADWTWGVAMGRNGQPRGVTVVVRDITQRRRAERALARQALHDALTDLPNRVLFSERMDEALDRAEHDPGFRFAVLQLDLNRFKHANDTYGHRCGDFILQEVARRLTSVLRDSDTVARLGGDEFAVILAKAEMDGARRVAERIQDAIKRPMAWDGLQLDIGTSIGIALYPDHGHAADLLLHHADVAMYGAKRAGKDFALFTPQQETPSPDATAA